MGRACNAFRAESDRISFHPGYAKHSDIPKRFQECQEDFLGHVEVLGRSGAMCHVASGGEDRWVTAPCAAAIFEASPTKSQMETAAGFSNIMGVFEDGKMISPEWSC